MEKIVWNLNYVGIYVGCKSVAGEIKIPNPQQISGGLEILNALATGLLFVKFWIVFFWRQTVGSRLRVDRSPLSSDTLLHSSGDQLFPKITKSSHFRTSHFRIFCKNQLLLLVDDSISLFFLTVSHQSLNNNDMPPPSIPGKCIRRDAARLVFLFSPFL